MLDKEFYRRDSKKVARELLGKKLVHEIGDRKISGKIVETEAYYGDGKDPASHAFNGKTERNKVMYETYGCAYVYLCYGVHELFNVTTSSIGSPGAVLIRALEPQEGVSKMKELREKENEKELTSGPGKVTQALNISRDHTGKDLTQNNLYIEKLKEDIDFETESSRRIGIPEDVDMGLRFYIKNNSFVSK